MRQGENTIIDPRVGENQLEELVFDEGVSIIGDEKRKQELPVEVRRVSLNQKVTIYKSVGDIDVLKRLKSARIVNLKSNNMFIVLKVGGALKHFPKSALYNLYVLEIEKQKFIFIYTAKNLKYKLVGMTYIGEYEENKLILTPNDKEFQETDALIK